MPITTILHLTDLHLGSGVAPRVIDQVLDDIVSSVRGRGEAADNCYIVVTGDVTVKGQKGPYTDAARFLQQLAEQLNPRAVLCCPGNHDISSIAESGRAFDEYNKFCLRVTGDHHQLFGNGSNVRLVASETADLTFLILNSAYHGDHNFGLVDVKQLRLAAADLPDAPVVVLLHHPVVASAVAGPGLRNAAEFLYELSKINPVALLHGHGHGEVVLHIGKAALPVLGVGSLFFPPVGNLNNQFGIYEVDNAGLQDAVV